MLPFQVRVDLGAMVMKEYSTFPKSPRLEPHHQAVWYHIQDNCWGGRSYASAEMQWVYTTGPAVWTVIHMINMQYISIYKPLDQGKFSFS